MLSEVDVSIRVKKLANGTADAVLELSLEDDACADQQVAKTVELVLLEASTVDVSIRHGHFAFVPLISLPDTLEDGAIAPSHLTVAFSLACLEVALVLSFFKLSLLAWQAEIVLESAEAVGTTVLEHSSELVTVLVVDFTQVVKASIVEGAWLGQILVLPLFKVQVPSTA